MSPHGNAGRPPPNKGRSPKQARNNEIALRVIMGWESCKDVAQDYGITAERVRQIVDRVDPDHHRVQQGTLVAPGADPLERRKNRTFRNRPFRPRLGHRDTKWYKKSHATRLSMLRIIGELADQQGVMPSIPEMQKAGISASHLASSFSGVRRYHTAIRRVARLLERPARTYGRFQS